jgi:hypothetical protein
VVVFRYTAVIKHRTCPYGLCTACVCTYSSITQSVADAAIHFIRSFGITLSLGSSSSSRLRPIASTFASAFAALSVSASLSSPSW